MSGASDQTLLSSTDGGGTPNEQLVLVSLGSPEEDFVHAGQVYPLRTVRKVRLGRADDGTWNFTERNGVLELAVPLAWVSGLHAELHLEGPLRLVDLGSRNGTLLEGVNIGTHASVGVGEVFEVGRSFWMLRRIRREIEEPQDGPCFANVRVRGLQRAIARLAPSDIPILLHGETGTGKERLARAIHVRSGRKGPFVAVNVAGSIERLLRNRSERLLSARGGTLYLEDVGELAPNDQTKLTSGLMSLAARDDPELGDVRLVSSSTRDLGAMVQAGTFRPDLMARIAGYEARLPPLRARREDLGLLAVDVLRRFARGRPLPRIGTNAFRSMLAHPWSFNLRELEHSLLTAWAMLEGDPYVIDSEIWGQACWAVEGGDPSPARVEAVRRELVQQLARHRGELPAVAAALQCELEDVQRWTERFSIRPERYRDVG